MSQNLPKIPQNVSKMTKKCAQNDSKFISIHFSLCTSCPLSLLKKSQHVHSFLLGPNSVLSL